jgi:lipoprotein-anchoring transpeptidase ErfK/SrfK
MATTAARRRTPLAVIAAVATALLAACAQQPSAVPSAAPPPVAAQPPAPAPEAAPASREIATSTPEPERFAEILRRHGLGFQPPAVGKAILVNIPAYELIAFENGEPVLRSKVIVGSPRTPTPVMDTETSVVRFRPTWRPTPDMIASGEYQDRVVPAGKKNPLGLLAVRLEPGLLIYLHGTNKPKLFEREKRALSHGCIRVEKWDEVAAWVLGVDVGTVHGHANGRSTFDMATSGVPVFLRYYTDFPNAEGEMVSHADIYGRGRTRLAAPRGPEPAREPPPSAVFGTPPDGQPPAAAPAAAAAAPPTT